MEDAMRPANHSNGKILGLQEIVDRITHGMLALDRQGRCIYRNRIGDEWMDDGQVSPDSVLGRGCSAAMDSQRYDCLEIYHELKDRWLEYNIYPSDTGITVLIKDITARKTAEADWKKAELEYRALIEQASDAIMITDQQGNFLDINSSLCNLFGYTREELLQTNVTRLIDPEELKTDPFQTQYLVRGNSELRERRMMHKNGTIIEVEVSAKMIPDGRLLAIARNITDRKKADEQILKEKAMSESIINSLPGIILIREVGGKNLRWNKKFEEISGYDAAEIPDLGPYHFFEDADKEIVRQRVQNKLLTEGRSSSEMTVVAKGGKRIPLFLTAMVVQLEGKNCVITIGLDISERLKMEEALRLANDQLRDLSAHLQNIREEERKRIALEIHDELGQQLTALRIGLAWAMNKCPKGDMVFSKLSDMDNLVDHTIRTVRRISSELRPSVLDDLGLIDALEWQSREFGKRLSIESRFDCQLTYLDISPPIVTGLFRIYQESLTNVARHAHATQVNGSLHIQNDRLILQISDDGKGFDPQALGSKRGFGLLGIRERTIMMDGECSIHSSPDQGTTITVSVPLAKQE
jgi:PAS domain S-box-containing protein